MKFTLIKHLIYVRERKKFCAKFPISELGAELITPQ